MWEITLIGTGNDMAHFRLLCDTLHNSYDGVVCALSSSNYVYCSIATMQDSILPEVQRIVVCTILQIAKIDYFDRHLELFKKYPIFRDFAIYSIVQSDIDDEIDFVMSNCNLGGNIYIHSFVAFRLQILVRVWQKICTYLDNQYTHGIESEWCLEFLKFISSNISASDSVFSIRYTEKKIKVHNFSSGKVKYFHCNNEIGAIIYLIVSSPKKIILQYDDKITERLNSLVSYIFDDKVCIVM